MQTSSSLQLFDATWIYFLGSRIADNYTRVILRECESAKTMRARPILKRGAEQRELGSRSHLRLRGRGIVVQMPLHFWANFLRITARTKISALAWRLPSQGLRKKHN
jgi:hypothetical protein